MEYYSAIKKNEIMPSAATWLDLEMIILSEIRQTLELNIQKTKIMASGPITSWQTDGETVQTMRDFIFLGSKIIADGDCNNEIKRPLAPWKKSYDQPK